ncbi:MULTISPECIES: TIGR03862 family flavoprotein [Xanthomonas]|uniref:Aminoacetone oxidase family FAD-binding enzyme n=1 Tax=Xanthomonas cucurbitae TaxID=56453 RepID=A0A2S7DIQ1_9XANT|nr:TIGR03862 family flavoprotein [Xanthomonas cucurbitae]PPU73705.1 aminoacetone oxidase family FAD-binding enzyme [Xanthomonas cucurbitae]QHG87432.1 TIGR03862 family flavoprotein [Xanthomonas cucurbitae]WDM69448.1 TIGR03862 family flavoprotein [Xanthomonas cucurbitae]WDM73321.1 TIGR03862 family flavoprotein [Xanthomonas cucurbitae]WDM74023.1 TIGR03862 family flavoprotein [Xanthomonas cucurbitae]
MKDASAPRLAVIGGGPAGLIAAEVACAAGIAVDLYEAKGSVGRKFLIAGKGGLNLTHSDPMPQFAQRYRERASAVAGWLQDFDADALRAWARELGVETYVGSSGRVFPLDRKAAPLLRGWVRRLKEQGVGFHVLHRWLGWSDDGALRFATPAGDIACQADATVLALGGGSWPQLGSDGAWQVPLQRQGIGVRPLVPANCGFDVEWSAYFAQRHAGAPLKPVVAHWRDSTGVQHALQGECVVTATGIEGSLVYAIAAELRAQIDAHGMADLALDLLPGRSPERIATELAMPRKGRSFSEHLRRQVGIEGVKTALVYELLGKQAGDDPARVARTLKHLPLRLLRPRPLAEAISSAGGVELEGLDAQLMALARPGVFCAGEMLDWEAPTGGYLLTACFASGRRAALGAVDWLMQQRGGATADHSRPRAATPT